jgi:chorismate dehydratase
MNRLRLSIVYYLNSLPLAWGFVHGRQRDNFHLDFSSPSRCADLLADGSVDIGLIPSIEYQRIRGVRVISGISIASKRQVQSVLLVSKIPAERIQTLAIDNSSRTSIVLLRILLALKYRVQPTLCLCDPDMEAMLSHSDAALIIGDNALRANFGDRLHYDLAEEWRMLTGKPFVFAFWGVRSEVRLEDPSVFQQSLAFGEAHLDEIVQQQSPILQLPENQLHRYLTENINYTLDQENLEGLQLFYQLAADTLGMDTTRGVEFVG